MFYRHHRVGRQEQQVGFNSIPDIFNEQTKVKSLRNLTSTSVDL